MSVIALIGGLFRGITAHLIFFKFSSTVPANDPKKLIFEGVIPNSLEKARGRFIDADRKMGFFYQRYIFFVF